MEFNRKKLFTGRFSLFRRILFIAFVLPFVFSFLTEVLGLPGVLRFSVDVVWILALLFVGFRQQLHMPRKLLELLVLSASFLVVTLVVYLFRYQSIFYYIWGVRNNFRFYVAFFAFAILFTQEDGLLCLKFMDSLFWINAVLCVVQFLMGNQQDNIGGIFGTLKGCNGYLLLYLTVVITQKILAYMNGRVSAWDCFSKSASGLFLSAIAELKFFYIVFVVILIFSAVLTAFSAKKVLLLLSGAILLSVAAALLEDLYSYFDGFFTVESLLETLVQSGYASSTDMGRTDAISVISEMFLTDVPLRLFGMGIGNCDTSSIALFNTSFSDSYVDLHYSIFSYAFMFIENGYVGLVLYCGFFAICLGKAGKYLKEKQGNLLFNQMAVVIAALCFLLMIYNSSLRTEAGYMVYLVLALPFMRPGSPEERKRELTGKHTMKWSHS